MSIDNKLIPKIDPKYVLTYKGKPIDVSSGHSHAYSTASPEYTYLWGNTLTASDTSIHINASQLNQQHISVNSYGTYLDIGNTVATLLRQQINNSYNTFESQIEAAGISVDFIERYIASHIDDIVMRSILMASMYGEFECKTCGNRHNKSDMYNTSNLLCNSCHEVELINDKLKQLNSFSAGV